MPLTARDVMTVDVKSVRSDFSVPDLERRFNDENVDGFAVVDDDVFRGEVSKSEILRKLDIERAEAETATGFWNDGSGIDSPLPAAEWVSAIIGKHMDHLRVSDVMNPQSLTVAPDEPLMEVARKITTNEADRVFVLDDRQLVGVISAYDFVRLYADRLIREKD